MSENLKENNRNLLQEALCYIFLVFLTLIILIWALELEDKDLNVPFSYTIDAFGPLKEVKNLILGNGLYDMPQLAAPLGGTEELTIKGFVWHFFLLKILTLFFDEAGMVINLYYLLGFLFTSITAFWVARKCKISNPVSIVVGIVYTLLPYHFYKGTFHIFYASYYLIPLACLVILNLICEEKVSEDFFQNKKIAMVYGIIISILVGLSDTYYGALFCILLFFSGVIGAFCNKKISCIKKSICYILLTGLSVVMAIAPTWLYTFFNETSNVFSSERSLFDIEFYSLKLSHLILPMHGHRIDFLNELRIAYDQNSVTAHESSYAALGILMTVGLVISVFCVFIKTKGRNSDIISSCGKINLFVLLVCSIGGLNVLIGLFLTTSIRSYARIVVFLAFFSALSIGLATDVLINWIPIKSKKNITIVISCFLICIGVFDQISPNFTKLGYYEVFSNSINRPYKEIEKIYESDRAFIEKIEGIVDDGAMILQLPIVSNSIYDVYPNGSSGAYGVARPFLHSSGKTRWSQGAQKGDDNDRWLTILNTYQYKDIIKIASIVGFSGIYIDTIGFDKSELDILLSYLNEVTEKKPIISDLGDLYYYDLTSYNAIISKSFGDKLEESRNILLQLGRLNDYHTIDSKDLYYLGNYKEVQEGMRMEKDSIQFGPYINLKSGVYKITLYGENLSSVNVSAYTKGDSINNLLEINNLKCTDNKITYYINSEEALEKFECSIKCHKDAIISRYEIEKIEEGEMDLRTLLTEINIILQENMETTER